ncbi:protochlorophyllide-dependent translocon component 52, chloroplastic [Trifolium repens]|nr:protochlorophyllide-dependent translocon component 52, chloroplastic [Trifolium repens]
MVNRDIPYGYEVLIENLMDPAHVPYAHYGVMDIVQPREKDDREGGRPLELSIEELDVNGFTATQGWSKTTFMPPSIVCFRFTSNNTLYDPNFAYSDPNKPTSSVETKRSSFQNKLRMIFFCIPVSPGNSRLIWCLPRNYGLWIDKIIPRWIFHLRQNLIIDSDLYLLHVEEKKIMDIGQENWHKACFVPTKSDGLVIGFRKWLKKYAGGQVDWRGKYSSALPPTHPREQLLDRYWSHVVNCKSCNLAYKSLNIVEVALQIISVAAIGIVAAMKQGAVSAVTRNSMVVLAVVSFALSRKEQMEAMLVFSVRSHHIPIATLETQTPLKKFMLLNSQIHSTLPLIRGNTSKFKLFTASSSSPLTESSSSNLQVDDEAEVEADSEKFDWYSQWYPLMPLCDLDKRAPHAKKVIGIDVVIWWDRNESEWKVFGDACPHRLSPLSEGRIDQWGRLQCVYHGWCFNGSGDCKFIPQAPRDGPPIHTSKKACVAAYPSTVQNDILWFWPNTDSQYKDIITRKTPPFIPELDDPSYTSLMGNRDIPCGYEVLVENLMDPAHLPYAQYGMLNTPKPKEKLDKEGGTPLELSIEKLDVNGFTANHGWTWSESKFMPPSIFYAYSDPNEPTSSVETKKSSVQKKFAMIFICIPVSPGNSRIIWCFPRNFGLWINKIVPRWMFHVGDNLVLDSDLNLLHVEEKKIMDVGQENWHKACFVPTKADALVIAFRKWLNKYAGGQVDWRGKYSGALPPTPPREQLLDRYWSHVVNCKSCNLAYKSLNVVEVALQIISVAAIGIVAAMKQGAVSAMTRNSMVVLAVVSFALSRFLAHFIYKYLRYHDYNHASR